jgi:hypothetical protein
MVLDQGRLVGALVLANIHMHMEMLFVTQVEFDTPKKLLTEKKGHLWSLVNECPEAERKGLFSLAGI